MADRALPRALVAAASLETELPRTLAVGAGTCIALLGTLEGRSGRSRPALVFDGERHPTVRTGLVLGSREPAVGFAGLVPIGPLGEPRRATVAVEVRERGRPPARERLGEIELLPGRSLADLPSPTPGGGGDTVAICMATFDPEPGLLERQIESIRAQTHADWVCVISDGGSSESRLRDLRSVVEGDPRFAVSRAEDRLGYYRNFERALEMAPAQARFVALADQDDRWYPDKLATLVAGLGDAALSYSDMRVTDRSDRTISDTFWSGRQNNYTNLSSLLLTNTVTGAASLCRRELLELALPFPPQVGTAFHDQWLACVALATGGIAYVDRPLYDYVQHGGASLGHAAALRDYDPRRLISWRDPRGTMRDIAAHGRRSFATNALRIAVAARALELRAAGRLAPGDARAVRRAGRLASSREPLAWLAARSLRGLAGRNETMGIELSLLAALAWRRLAAARAMARVA